MTKDEFWESLCNLMSGCSVRDVYFYEAALDELLKGGKRAKTEIWEWASAKAEYEQLEKEKEKVCGRMRELAKILGRDQEYWG